MSLLINLCSLALTLAQTLPAEINTPAASQAPVAKVAMSESAGGDSGDDMPKPQSASEKADIENAPNKTPEQIKTTVMRYLRKPYAGLLKNYMYSLPPMTDEQATACLDALLAGYNDANPTVRTSSRTLITALVVGKWPTCLENRLGDFSEKDLSSKGPDIERQHEQLVSDIKDFIAINPDKKTTRIQILERLQKRAEFLSALDQEDIDRQLTELRWQPDELNQRLANAEVMLAFNYGYFEGLSAKQKILKNLKDALQLNPKVASDAVFCSTAKKALAQTDAQFMTLYRKAANAEFDPASIPASVDADAAGAGKASSEASAANGTGAGAPDKEGAAK